MSRTFPPAEEYWYRHDSARVRREAAHALGWQLVGPSWTAVESALGWMPQRFVYDVTATNALTPVEEVIAQGAGVCQDFAHVLLSLLPLVGVLCPLRLRVLLRRKRETRSPSRPRPCTPGSRCSGPGSAGSVSMRPPAPTPIDRYVPVGFGRDYDDVRPIRGVVAGSPDQQADARLEMRQLHQ